MIVGQSGRATLLLLAAVAMAMAHGPAHAQRLVDIMPWFERASRASGEGLARKTRLVDVRAAKPGEVIVTVIKGEGKETQSPPAASGDRVVKNRCAATGNEQILVGSATFAQRYIGPLKLGTVADGWQTYRPRGVPMRFVGVGPNDGTFSFLAPWGERMVARPGDVIVQDRRDPKNTYRIARAAFECTYEVLRAPGKFAPGAKPL